MNIFWAKFSKFPEIYIYEHRSLYGMFRGPFWDPVLNLFCGPFFKT